MSRTLSQQFGNSDSGCKKEIHKWCVLPDFMKALLPVHINLWGQGADTGLLVNIFPLIYKQLYLFAFQTRCTYVQAEFRLTMTRGSVEEQHCQIVQMDTEPEYLDCGLDCRHTGWHYLQLWMCQKPVFVFVFVCVNLQTWPRFTLGMTLKGSAVSICMSGNYQPVRSET